MSYFKHKVYAARGEGGENLVTLGDNVPFVERLLDPSISETQLKSEVWQTILDLGLWDDIEGQKVDEKFHLRKIKGALTNVIYEAIYDNKHSILLRIFGAKLEAIVDRSYEITVLQRLQDANLKGPRIVGCFVNGRFEAYIRGSSSVAPDTLCDPWIMKSISSSMHTLHNSVPLYPYERKYKYGSCFHKLEEWNTILDTVGSDWINDEENLIKYLHCNDWEFFKGSVLKYRDWLFNNCSYNSVNDFVFAHNDLQHGNVLLINQEDTKKRETMLIDFEYAGPNAIAFDIANHLSEWMHDYDKIESYQCNYKRFPKTDKINEFIKFYLDCNSDNMNNLEESKLYNDVLNWRPCSQLFWSIWAILQSGTIQSSRASSNQSTPNPVTETDDTSFQYLLFCQGKLSTFWGDLIQFGIIDKDDPHLITQTVNYINI
ncbi:Ethanolamine kinase [Nakaseomyces bracarensis]|uniref:Ethanolamine kinase n=1 Tax=Nakaseomyces bracarensis TaxID=273131 RepID=A0ABR4NT67_9SACH